MRKKITAVILIVFSFFLVSPVFAAPNINELTGQVAQKGGYDTAGVTDTTLSESIGKIIRTVMALVGTIFLALTVYAGILWMTAQGNDEKVTKAQGILKTSIMGLVIVVAAYSITYFVLGSIIRVSAPTAGQVGSGQTGGGFWSGFASGFGGKGGTWWGGQP